MLVVPKTGRAGVQFLLYRPNFIGRSHFCHEMAELPPNIVEYRIKEPQFTGFWKQRTKNKGNELSLAAQYPSCSSCAPSQALDSTQWKHNQVSSSSRIALLAQNS